MASAGKRSADDDAASSRKRAAPEEFYNSKPMITQTLRQQSPILRMRSLNNWIKSVLISSNIPKSARVLDLCCGKGGDLLKFANANVSHVFGVDIAQNSVSEAASRHRERHADASQRFEANFVRADVCDEDLAASGKYGDHHFDFVNCQFAIHYSFSSEATARMLLRNAASRLVTGGRFVGTVPNANLLVKRLRSIEGTSWSNSVYSVKFDDRNTRPFGHSYVFHLVDAVEDVPEYVTPLPVLKRLARDEGLKLLYYEPFHKFFYDNCALPEHYELLRRMQVLQGRQQPSQTLTDDEWEAAGIYAVFVFEKIATPEPKPAAPEQKEAAPEQKASE